MQEIIQEDASSEAESLSTPLTRTGNEDAPPPVRARRGVAIASVLSDPDGTEPADLAQLLGRLLTTPGASTKQLFMEEQTLSATLA